MGKREQPVNSETRDPALQAGHFFARASVFRSSADCAVGASGNCRLAVLTRSLTAAGNGWKAFRAAWTQAGALVHARPQSSLKTAANGPFGATPAHHSSPPCRVAR